MKPFSSALAFVSLLSVTASAMAQSSTISLDPGPVSHHQIGGFHGSATYTYSENFVGATDVMRLKTAAVPPAVVSTDDLAISSVHMPVRLVKGELDGWGGTYTQVDLKGGFNLSYTPGPRRNVATTGGSLSLTDIQVDLVNKRVYADLTGANGVGFRDQALIWSFSTIVGAPSLNLGNCPALGNCQVGIDPVTLGGLNITSEAFDLFGTSLGLTHFGRAALGSVGDFGTITISAVPEPGGVLLSLSGLAAMGWVAAGRRRQAAAR